MNTFFSKKKIIVGSIIIVIIIVISGYFIYRNYKSKPQNMSKEELIQRQKDLFSYRITIQLKNESSQESINNFLSDIKSDKKIRVGYVAKDSPINKMFTKNAINNDKILATVTIQTNSTREKSKLIEYINQNYSDLIATIK